MQRSLLSSFVRLRWFAFFGQAIVLGLSVFLFNLTLPWGAIGALLLLIPLSNFLTRSSHVARIEDAALVGSLLIFDTILLTLVLGLAGGPTNPFTIVYLLHVVLSAVLLNARWTWVIAALSCMGFSLLFVAYRAVPEWAHHGAHHGFSLHLHGMLIAYVAVAILVAYFLNKIVNELQRNKVRLIELEQIAVNQQRLATLTTLTAGAAHELGTPLGTIAVVSHELERALKLKFPDEDLLSDVMLLKSETARCKKVLGELSRSSGDLVGEALQTFSVSQLITDALEPLPNRTRVVLREAPDLLFHQAQRNALTLGVRALVKNALEATADNSEEVLIKVSKELDTIEIEISDAGLGMSEEQLARLGVPFFSTKGAENGMGLGVYLTKLMAEQLGGSLKYRSFQGKGTVATLSVRSRGVVRELAA